MDLAASTITFAMYIPIIARIAAGAVLIAAGILILVLGRRRYRR